MKPFVALLLAFVSPYPLGCEAVEGSGTIVTKSYPVARPQKLSSCCGFEISITEGAQSALRVTGDDNILAELIVHQDGNGLTVALPHTLGGYALTRRIGVELTTPELRAIEAADGSIVRLGPTTTQSLSVQISGGGRLEIEALEAKSLDLALSGGSEAILRRLELQMLDVASSGGGRLDAGGRVADFTGAFSGGGRLAARECQVETMSLALSGGTDGRVWATRVLDAKVSGGGRLLYRGDPRLEVATDDGSEVSPEVSPE